jgi:hypothetical protein
MEIVITGHTSGLGKALYDHYSLSHSVTGVSRSTGFDIGKDQEKILELVKNSDLFINCAHCGSGQEQLLDAAVNKVPNIVVIGTTMQSIEEFSHADYIIDKRSLAEKCRSLSIDPSVKTNILLMNISFLPRKENSLMKTDNHLDYVHVIDTIDYWLKYQNISEINFSWKLTDLVLSEFKRLAPNGNFEKFKRNKND